MSMPVSVLNPAMLRPAALSIACALVLLGCNRPATDTSDAAVTPPPPASTAAPAPTPDPAATAMAQPDAQMQAVLDQLAKLGPKPIETLTAAQARAQPSPADAVKALLKAQSKPTAPEAVAKVENRTFPGPAGAVPIRIYTPAGSGPMPVILYIHGGGWVIANLDTYDASPRALANAAKAIVVSTHYRQAPENKFPAAHEDTLAAYKWVLANAGKFGGDPKRVAVVGESAGGNMAADIAIAARDQKLQAPVHQLLIYPVAGNDMNTPSYIENANAKPLGKAGMQWFVKQTFNSPQDAADPRINLVDRTNLAGLAPATVIVDQIDPLRSEGRAYADALKAAGVPVTLKQYDGVTHEFFGMGAVVDKAKQAQQLAGQQLSAAFAKDAAAPMDESDAIPMNDSTPAPDNSR